MCQKRNTRILRFGDKTIRIDACIVELIRSLNRDGLNTVASCCGHGKYPVTILHKSNDPMLKGNIYDYCSGWGVRRKNKFYKRDKQGYYFIPEVAGGN